MENNLTKQLEKYYSKDKEVALYNLKNEVMNNLVTCLNSSFHATNDFDDFL